MAKARAPKRKPAKPTALPARKAAAKKKPAAKKPTARKPAGKKLASLDKLYTDWDAFLPRETKATRLTFLVTLPSGTLSCLMRFQYYCYIDVSYGLSAYGYVGNRLRETIGSFITGTAPTFPGHPDAVFQAGSVKIERVPSGYQRSVVKDKLEQILSAAFPPR